jgi:hypothetical protein
LWRGIPTIQAARKRLAFRPAHQSVTTRTERNRDLNG